MQLYVREGDRRVCVASLESPHGLRTIVPDGRVAAARPGLGRRDPVGRADRRCADGWAESVEEREAGVASVSAGVARRRRRGGGRRQRVGARSSAPPASPGARYGDAVAAAARRIERAAGLTA